MGNETWVGSGIEQLTGTGAQMMPAVAVLAGGRFVVAWVEGATSAGANGYSVHAQLFDAGGNMLGNELVLNQAPFADSFLGPQLRLAALAGGGFVASWDTQTGSGATDPTSYVSRLFDRDAAATSAEFQANSQANPYHGEATTIALANGGFLVGWLDYNTAHGPQPGVQIYDAAGRPVGQNIIGFQGDLSPPGGSADIVGFDAAALAGGGFELVWTRYTYDPAQPSAPHTDTYAQRFDAAGRPTSEVAWMLGSQANLRLTDPHATVQPDTGNTVLAEFSDRNASENNTIVIQGLDAAGHGVFGPGRIAPGPATYDVQLAGLPDGGYVVSWLHQGTVATDASLFAQRYDLLGTPLGGVIQVGATSGFDEFNMRHGVAATADGGAIFVWEDDQPDGADIYLERFVPSAPSIPGAVITGTPGNDVLAGTAGDDSIDGGAGRDTVVYGGSSTAATIVREGQGVRVTGPQGNDLLTAVERLQFADLNVALDVDGPGGMAYRLYQAAFDRAPDLGGLGFWIGSLDAGLPLAQAAQYFMDSAEFAAKYGALDTAQFVDQLYRNVLHREADAGGRAFWTDHLAHADLTRAETLVYFSESAENQAAVIGLISNGMPYLP